MVEVRMAEHDRVDARRVERKISIPLEGVPAVALVESGIEEQPGAARIDQVHRAGHFARGTPELDVHEIERSASSRRGQGAPAIACLPAEGVSFPTVRPRPRPPRHSHICYMR